MFYYGKLSSVPWKIIGSLPHSNLQMGFPWGHVDLYPLPLSGTNSALFLVSLQNFCFLSPATCLQSMHTISLPPSMVLCPSCSQICIGALRANCLSPTDSLFIWERQWELMSCLAAPFSSSCKPVLSASRLFSLLPASCWCLSNSFFNSKDGSNVSLRNVSWLSTGHYAPEDGTLCNCYCTNLSSYKVNFTEVLSYGPYVFINVHIHGILKCEHGVCHLFFKELWISPRSCILLLWDAFLFRDKDIFVELNIIHLQLMLHTAISHGLITASQKEKSWVQHHFQIIKCYWIINTHISCQMSCRHRKAAHPSV